MLTYHDSKPKYKYPGYLAQAKHIISYFVNFYVDKLVHQMESKLTLNILSTYTYKIKNKIQFQSYYYFAWDHYNILFILKLHNFLLKLIII